MPKPIVIPYNGTDKRYAGLEMSARKWGELLGCAYESVLVRWRAGRPIDEDRRKKVGYYDEW